MARLGRDRNKLMNTNLPKRRIRLSLDVLNFLMILGIYAILAKMNGWI